MKYYIAINGQPKGPFDHHQLLINGLTPTSLVWTEGMTGWTQAQSVPELQELLFGSPDLKSSSPDEVTSATPPPFGSQQSAASRFSSAASSGNFQRPPFNGGTSYTQPPVEPMPYCPKTWLVESILVTIFCCLPFGIVGIVKASGVESAWRRGDYQGAEIASQSAGFWTKLGFWIGLGINIIVPLFYILGAAGLALL